MKPAVSVLCCVHDGARFVERALRSVIDQTFGDFELIVVDDGSTDATPEILAGVADADQRVRLCRHAHSGLTASLNAGLQLARADLVARQDADDISLPHRFDQQARFLDKHPDHLVVGTCYSTIDEHGTVLQRRRPPLFDLAIRTRLLQANMLAHSSVMFRRDAILSLGGYDTAYATAQDYDLWCRVARHGKLANLWRIGLLRRQHAGSVSTTQQQAQRRSRDAIRSHYRQTIRATPAKTWRDVVVRAVERATR